MAEDLKDPTRIYTGKTEKIDKIAAVPIKSEGEFKADKKMIDRVRAQKDIKKRSEDLLKTADKAIESGDKNLLMKIAQTAEKADDKNTLKELINRVAKNKMLKTGAKQIAGAIPLIGGVLSALSSGDASAALPLLGDSESLGPSDPLEAKLESGANLTPTEIIRLKAMQQASMRGQNERR